LGDDALVGVPAYANLTLVRGESRGFDQTYDGRWSDMALERHRHEQFLQIKAVLA
jgi:hypothetical protein